MLERDRERLRQEGGRLVRMPSGSCDERLGVEGACQRFGQSKRLGDVERELGPLARPLGGQDFKREPD